MKEKKETFKGFDDTKDEKNMQRIIRAERENKKLSDNFLKKIVDRINNGITTYYYEIKCIPNKDIERFNKIYDSTQ